MLSIVFAVLVYMGGTARAEEAPSEHAAAVVGISADPSTAESNILGTAADGGRYIGRVWTDKSVFTDGTTLDGTSLTKKNADDPYEFLTVFSALGSSQSQEGQVQTLDGTSLTKKNADDPYEFLTVFSALGSSQSQEGQVQLPLDVVFVIDVSGSMTSRVSNSDRTSRIAKTVEAVNNAINTVMSGNPNSRVGLVTFSSAGYPNSSSTGATTILELGRYTPTLDGNTTYIKMDGSDKFRVGVQKEGSSQKVSRSYEVKGGTNAQNP